MAAELPPPKYLLSQLPSNLALSFALSRFMVFVTSPDLAPDEEQNISRGVAFHMGLSVHYCSLRERLRMGFGDMLARTQHRLLLSLPTELLATAAGGLSASTMSQSERALVQVAVWDAAFRDALSTRYVTCLGMNQSMWSIMTIFEEMRKKDVLDDGVRVQPE
ncbi:hypothetical protein BDW22DRAFT_1433703 [Trametopsis cervina]|nr:hypothetical protein BDW22DRAFT_1433703 [Trametopsis cervina]